MTADSTGGLSSHRSAFRLLSFIACVVVIGATFSLSSATLNVWVPYTLPGGAPLFKFHPATWITLLLVPHVAIELVRHRAARIWSFLPALGMALLLVVYLLSRSKSALASTFVDIYIAPLLLGLTILSLPASWARVVLLAFVAVAFLNVLIVSAEFAMGGPLLPLVAPYAEFRPGGLAGHPIMAATVFYCAMFVVARELSSPVVVRSLMLVFLAGVAMCGVRGPLAMAGALFVWNVASPGSPRRTIVDYAIDVVMLAALPLGILFMASHGAFDRVLETGIWEESAQSRFLIFHSLDLLTTYELWWGVPSYDAGESLAMHVTGNTLIESAVISTLFQAGAPAAIAMLCVIWIAFGPAMRRSPAFGAAVLLVLITTLGFGTKNMIAPAMIMVACSIVRPRTVTKVKRERARPPRAFTATGNLALSRSRKPAGRV